MALTPDNKLVEDADADQLPRALNTSDRPEVLTWHHTSNLDENPVRVQVGFRFRPLRDGGGKPSPGIKPPHKRPTSRISHKGSDILRLIQPWLPSLSQRLDNTSKEKMFTDSQLEELRRTLSSGTHSQEEGQPFYLDLISELALAAEDPDSQYPQS